MPGTGFRMTITAPGEEQLTAGTAVAEGDILLILDNGQGETTLGRIKADCKGTYLVLHEVSAGELATAIGSRTDMLSITVTGGTLDETDWAAVVKNDDALLSSTLREPPTRERTRTILYIVPNHQHCHLSVPNYPKASRDLGTMHLTAVKTWFLLLCRRD